MPRRRGDGWRGPRYEGEFPTLGWVAIDWIEDHCVVPDGDLMGERFRLTDEQARFVLRHYRLVEDASGPRGAFRFRRSMIVRPQKWGKGPLTAALICFEGVGPARFDGWDSAGDPVGRPWSTPWVQIAAATEDQTANVYRALLPMIREGPLADALPDTGLTRINIPGGGLVEPVTAEGRSRLGQRLTFAVHDEPHSWTRHNGGHQLADTQRRNLAGMGGRAVATTNAWDPAEQSDAQLTAESGLPDVLVDYPPVPAGSVRNRRDRRRVLRAVYGDSAAGRGGWVDLERIDAEIDELVSRGDEAQAERFYLNRVVATSDAFFDADAWDSAADRSLVPPDGAPVALGFDGSMYDDWTVLRGRWLRQDGSLAGFTPTFGGGAVTVWDPARFAGEVPRSEVAAAVEELFDRFRVTRLYADPELWQSELDSWASRWPGRVVVWPTYRTRPMAAALERLRTDVATGVLSHDGCPVTAAHVRNARRVRRSGGVVVGKPNSHQKIDAAVADALAHEAGCDSLAAGEAAPPKRRRMVLM